MKQLFVAITIIFICGCGGGNWVQFKPLSVEIKKTDFSVKFEKSYNINSVMVASVGNPIFQVTEYHPKIRKTETAVPSENISLKLKWRLRSFFIETWAGREYEITGTAFIENVRYYLVKIPGIYSWGIFISEDGRPIKSCVYSYDNEMLYYPLENIAFPESYTLKPVREIDYIKGKTYELIFSGKNDFSLNFMYREFTANDMARPAFYQNVTYRATADQFQFKDFVIRIHDLTNEKITFKILRDGLK